MKVKRRIVKKWWNAYAEYPWNRDEYFLNRFKQYFGEYREFVGDDGHVYTTYAISCKRMLNYIRR